MDIFLLIIASLFIIIGLIGCFIPVVPGPPLSWIGILFVYFTENSIISPKFLYISLAITIVATALDYIIPIWGTKKFGGTKSGVRGSMIGLIVGIFFSPIGIIIGPFLGALIAELLHDSKDFNKALKSAMGSFVGFLLGTGLKLGVSLTLAWYYVLNLIEKIA